MTVIDRRLSADSKQHLSLAPAQWAPEMDDPLAAPEWTLPARHVAVLALIAVLIGAVLAWAG